MISTFILGWLLFVLGAAYSVRVLMFDPNAPGPFESKTDFVMYNGDSRPVNLFDKARRLFGVYTVTPRTGYGVWVPVPARLQVWVCPKCLSFWLCSPWSAALVLSTCVYTNSLWPVLLFLPVHLSITFTVQLLVFIQLRIEAGL